MGNLASAGFNDDGANRLALKVSDHVQYFSETHDAWIDCVVTDVAAEGAVEVSCKRGHWMPLEEQLAKLRPIGVGGGGAAVEADRRFAGAAGAPASPEGAPPPPLAAGDVVMYWSSTHSRWVPSRVTGVKTSGEVQVDVKAGYWMSHEEQGAKLRSTQGLFEDLGLGEALSTWSGKVGGAPDGCPHAAPSDVLALSERALSAHNNRVPPSSGFRSPPSATETPASRAPSLDSFASLIGSSPGGGAWGSTTPGRSNSHGIFGSISSLGEPSRDHVPQSAPALNSFASVQSEGFQSVFGGFGTADTLATGVSDGAAGGSSAMASMASIGSVSSLPSPPAAGCGRVGFAPSVEVMAFKGSCPPSKLQSKGRSFESSFERRVEVPKTWSFGSVSSMSSLSSAGGPLASWGSLPPSGPRLQPLHEDMELVPQRA